MKKTFAALIVSALLITQVQPVAAADEKGVDELAVEGLSKLMDALSLFVSAIPQYSTPEILENGDIIIRRKNKPAEDEKETPNKPEETST